MRVTGTCEVERESGSDARVETHLMVWLCNLVSQSLNQAVVLLAG